MQSINEIHAKIQAEYRRMQSEHEMNKAGAKDMLYALLPRIEEIDREISSLAVTNARRVLEEKITPEQAAESIRIEADRLRKERQDILNGNNIKEYTPQYACEKCCDTGYGSDGRKCGCYIKKIREYLSLPGEKGENTAFKNSTFDKFVLDYYPAETDPAIGIAPRDLMRAVYANCANFAHSFGNGFSGNLLLCGPSGLGKTFMAGCIANAVSDKGYIVIYKSSYKLFQFLDDYKFGKIDRDAYSALYDTIYDCDLLIIDDFGTEFITSYTQAVFFDLLSTRLSCEKSTVISTNLSFEKMGEIYQERVMSRLQNEFNVLRFAGTDIRAVKNNK
ncbi:MAG: ATP-binding protein [Clostridia bacterium]|nr:ATP-binding protein [Clostridia bacterium]